MTSKDAFVDIEFTDYSPGELPDKLPQEFWASFDSCGEFMYASARAPSAGGIAAHYVLKTVRS